jgi:SMI1-KNR4 cell-wall
MQDWSQHQNNVYRDILVQSQILSWKELASKCIDTPRFRKPVTAETVSKAESVLGRSLPKELISIYHETDGIFDATGANIVSSLSDMVDDNLDLWGKGYEDVYMSLTSLFAFGGPGNGDRFFIPITPNGNYRRGVYLWNHENDSRTWLANGIKDFLIRCRVNRIQ